MGKSPPQGWHSIRQSGAGPDRGARAFSSARRPAIIRRPRDHEAETRTSKAASARRHGALVERARPELPRAPGRAREATWPSAAALGRRGAGRHPPGRDRGPVRSRRPTTRCGQRVFKLSRSSAGKDFRNGRHPLPWSRPRGLRFLFFLERKRRRNVPLSLADLRAARARIVGSLVPNVGRAAFPYLQDPASPRGRATGIAVHNPLLGTERIVQRAIGEALTQAAHQTQGGRAPGARAAPGHPAARAGGHRLPAHPPPARGHGHGLRGPLAGPPGLGPRARGRPLRGRRPSTACSSSSTACAGNARSSRPAASPRTRRIFVNTLPATMRDPQFRGKALIDFLDKAQVAPDRIVIEITEKLVIDNYGLFRETMSYFTDLGMSFAVDDVGAGYSGLESIAHLKPDLPEDRHRPRARRPLELGEPGDGARPSWPSATASGPRSSQKASRPRKRASALRAMGVDFGQGYHLARPDSRPGAELSARLGAPSAEGGAPSRTNLQRARAKRTSSPCCSSRSLTAAPLTRVRFVEPRSRTK